MLCSYLLLGDFNTLLMLRSWCYALQTPSLTWGAYFFTAIWFHWFHVTSSSDGERPVLCGYMCIHIHCIYIYTDTYIHTIPYHYINIHINITLHIYIHTYPASPRSMLSFSLCVNPQLCSLTQTTGHAKFATPQPSNCPCSPWSSLRWRSLAPPPPWAPWAAPAAPHAPRQCEPRSLRRWSWCSASVVKLGTFQRNPHGLW